MQPLKLEKGLYKGFKEDNYYYQIPIKQYFIAVYCSQIAATYWLNTLCKKILI